MSLQKIQAQGEYVALHVIRVLRVLHPIVLVRHADQLLQAARLSSACGGA
jgi:hypothetical protein